MIALLKRRNMDKYMKFVLTMIAVGIIGINFQLFKGDIISKANASSNDVHKIAICNEQGNKCAAINMSRGLKIYSD